MRINGFVYRVLAVLLLGVIVLNIPVQVCAVSYDIENGTEQSYIVKADNEYVGTEIEDKYDAEKISEDEVLYSVNLTDYEKLSIRRDGDIVSIEPDVYLDGAGTETEENINVQWNLEAIGVNEEQNNSDSGEGIKIAVLDSGIALCEDVYVTERVTLIPECENVNPLYADNTGHGTAIASVIAANKGDEGIDGISPNAEIYSVQVLDECNQAPLSRIIEGIYWAIDNNMDIINMSFGTSVNSEILHNAIKTAYANNILLISSAGNSAHQSVQYPAAYPEVLAVGSVDAEGNLSENTSVGDGLDVLAPGENIMTNSYFGFYTGMSGTSIATAQVTGIAALLWSRDKNKTADFIKNLIIATSKDNTNVGTGIIDYAFASEMYNDFSQNYTTDGDTQNVVDYSNASPYIDYSEDASLIVEGLWNNIDDSLGHVSLSNKAVSQVAGKDYAYTEDQAAVLKYACTKTDRFYGAQQPDEDLRIIALHGALNYVYCLKYVLEFANAMTEIVDTGDDEQLRAAAIAKIEEVEADFTTSHPSVNHSKEENQEIPEFAKHAIRNAYLNDGIYPVSYKNKSETVVYMPELTPETLNAMFVGIAIHLTGDIFAHNTIVPKYTIAGVNDQTAIFDTYQADKFGAGDFPGYGYGFTYDDALKTDLIASVKEGALRSQDYHTWQHFQLTVSQNVVEFSDIGMFLSENASNHYEDNASFCQERYQAALLATRRVSTCAARGNDFYIGLIFPKKFTIVDGTENDKYTYVKLNNMKKFTIAAELDLYSEHITDDEWNQHSTSAYV